MKIPIASVLKPPVDRAQKHLLSRGLFRNANMFVCIVLLLAAVLSGCGRKKNRTAIPVSTRPPLASVPGAWEEGIASWYGHPYHGRRTANGEVYDQEQMTAAHPTLRFHTTVEVTNLNNGLRTRVRINDRGPFVKNRAIDLSRAAAREIEMLGPGTAPVRVEVLSIAGVSAASQTKPVPVAPTAGPEASTAGMNQPGSSPVSTVPARYPAAKVPPSSEPEAGASTLPETRRGVAAARQEQQAGSDSSAIDTMASAAGFAIQMGAFASYENAVRLRDSLAGHVSPVRIVEGTDPTGTNRVIWRVLVGQRLSKQAADKLFSTLRVDFPRIILVFDH